MYTMQGISFYSSL